MAASALRVTLELEQAGEPISGTLTADQERHPFRGWIELATLIDSLRAPSPGSDDDPWTPCRPA